MPTFKQGNMWDCFDEVDYFIITTNSTVKTNGALVMGRGIAMQARDRFPGLDKALGSAILQHCGYRGIYGLLLSEKLGAFQVKTSYADEAQLFLIKISAQELATEARHQPTKTFALNFPGIGNGKLAYQAVLPLLEFLPDNVHIWTYA